MRIKTKIAIVVLLTTVIFSTKGQVSSLRIPAEWEEIQAVIMIPSLYTRNQTYSPWELRIDPYIKVAEACINENIDIYFIEKESQSYTVSGNTVIIQLDTIFQNRGIASQKIHIIQVNDTLIGSNIWARDNGMFCVFENNVDNMKMYHFENDKISSVVDTLFNLNSIKIPTEEGNNSGYLDGGNFLTDGHSSFNIMVDTSTEIAPDYLHFYDYFGIEKSVKLAIHNDCGVHIDYCFKLINEETFLVAYRPQTTNSQKTIDSAVAFIKNNLLSVYDREFKIIPIENAPNFDSQINNFFNTEQSASYINSLILNNTVLVPQYACNEFQPKTDSIALEAYRNAMPRYNIVGVNCSAYQGGGGALHCLTRDIPTSKPIYIKHKWRQDSIENNSEGFHILVTVQSSQGISNVKLFWKLAKNSSYNEQDMLFENQDTYTATIPSPLYDTEIEYYITATDNLQKSVSKPYIAEKSPYKFKVYNTTTSIKPTKARNIIIYPNPVSNNILYLQSSTPIQKVDIIDLWGNVLISKSNNNIEKINVDKLPNGIYFIKIAEKNYKIIKN